MRKGDELRRRDQGGRPSKSGGILPYREAGERKKEGERGGKGLKTRGGKANEKTHSS